MTTWGAITTELGTFLDDAAAETYVELLRMSAWNRAMDYFATTHTALLKSATASAPTGGEATMTLALPPDFISVAGIKLDDTWLEPNSFIPGEAVSDSGYRVTASGVLMPTGESDVDFWYYALYPHVDSINDAILVPAWAMWPLINLALAYIHHPASIGMASLRRWQTRMEAGQPTDNPSRTQALYHFDIYRHVVDRVKPQDREMLFNPGR